MASSVEKGKICALRRELECFCLESSGGRRDGDVSVLQVHLSPAEVVERVEEGALCCLEHLLEGMLQNGLRICTHQSKPRVLLGCWLLHDEVLWDGMDEGSGGGEGVAMQCSFTRADVTTLGRHNERRDSDEVVGVLRRLRLCRGQIPDLLLVKAFGEGETPVQAGQGENAPVCANRLGECAVLDDGGGDLDDERDLQQREALAEEGEDAGTAELMSTCTEVVVGAVRVKTVMIASPPNEEGVLM